MCRSQVGLDVRVGLFATIGSSDSSVVHIYVVADVGPWDKRGTSLGQAGYELGNEVPLGYQFGVSDSQMGCHEFHWGVISVGVLPLVCDIQLYV